MNLTAAAYNSSGLPWYVTNRYWNVKSNAIISDSILIRFPYNNVDFNAIKGSNPIVQQYTDLDFLIVNGKNNPLDLAVSAINFMKNSW